MKTTIVTLAIALTIVFASCGSSNENTENATPNADSATVQVDTLSVKTDTAVVADTTKK